MSYEAARLENIRKNNALLAELNLKHQVASKRSSSESRGAITKPARRVTRKLQTPTRISARVANDTKPRPSYNEDEISRNSAVSAASVTTRRGLRSKGRAISRVKVEPIKAEDDEPMDSNLPAKDVATLVAAWRMWTPTGPLADRDAEGTFHFDDEPTFTPNKSPAEVLREGAFGGGYYRPIRSRKLGIMVEDDWRELPPEWIEGLDPRRFLTSSDYDADVNKFKVSCGQTIEEWEAAGWIRHEHDVRGWFQWYTRFFQGRRCDDDERQISRWRKCVGETGRWRRMLLKKYGQLGVRTVFDDGEDEDTPEVSPVMHQTCHHWAYEIRQEVLDEFWSNGAR